MNYLLNNINGWVQSGPMGNDLMGYGAVSADPPIIQSQTVTAGEHGENLVPELWSDMIFDYLQKKLVFKNLLQDYSELVSGRGDVIHVPKLIAGTGAQQAGLGNAGADFGGQAASAIQFDGTNELEATITIDQHWYAAKMVTDVLKVQALPGMMEKYTMGIAYDLANKMDSYIESVLSAGVTTNTVTPTAGATDFDDEIPLDNWATLFEKVRAVNVDPIADGCVLVVNYKIFGGFMNPASEAGKYLVKADVTAGANGMVSGVVPTFWGVPVIMSNNIGTGASEKAAYLLHPQSFGFASSIAPRVTSQYDIDYLSTKVVADSLFGCAAINEDFSAVMINPAN
tara:strand:- start:6829 stop:7851 length:1023 start_codon:yes stop_codon:yes gene_type:complete